MVSRDNATAQRAANETSFPESIADLSPRWMVGMDGRRHLGGVSRHGSRSYLAFPTGEISSGNLLFAASTLTDDMKCIAWALKILAQESIGEGVDEDQFRQFTDISARLIDNYMDDLNEYISLASHAESKKGAAP